MAIRDGDRDVEQAKARVIELELCINELKQGNPVLQDPRDLNTQIHEKEQVMAQRQAAVYGSQYTQVMAGLEAELKQLYAAYDKTTKLANGVKPGVKCPSCMRAVTADNIDAMRSEIRAGLPEIAANGKELKARLAEIREMDEKAKQVFSQFQSDDTAILNCSRFYNALVRTAKTTTRTP